jgi:hypothetical protein
MRGVSRKVNIFTGTGAEQKHGEWAVAAEDEGSVLEF